MQKKLQILKVIYLSESFFQCRLFFFFNNAAIPRNKWQGKSKQLF